MTCECEPLLKVYEAAYMETMQAINAEERTVDWDALILACKKTTLALLDVMRVEVEKIKP